MNDAQANPSRCPMRPSATLRNRHAPGAGRTVIVSRHPGALEWLRRRGIDGDQRLAHLDPAMINSGDTVIGTLPLDLAGKLCRKGAEVIGLVINTPAKWRGRELTADQIEAANARLRRFEVIDRGPWPGEDNEFIP